MKTAVVIAYCAEPDETIRRAIDSVRSQTERCTAFLVSDGHPRGWIDDLPVRHVRLGVAHGDFGDTARGIGAAAAVREGFDAVSFLDADNYYLPDHIGVLADAQCERAADVVTSSRFLVRPDGRVFERDEIDDSSDHTDSSCYFITGRGLDHVHCWLDIPRELGVIGDRMYWLMLRHRELKIEQIGAKTVGYTTNWKVHFESRGEPPPPGAKPNVDLRPLAAWWNGLIPEEKERIRDRMRLPGFNIA